MSLSLKEIINANTVQLQMGVAVLGGVSTDLFSRSDGPVRGSSIGPHVRHIIEFYDCFRSGVIDGHVDYSKRARDLRTETDSAYATTRLQEIVTWLQSIAVPGESKLVVRQEPVTSSGNGYTSSYGRELEFLLSHTTHHYAMIAVILQANGVSVAEGFGLATSTQLHLIDNGLRITG